MKSIKCLVAIAALLITITTTTASAIAQEIGVVDLDKVVNNYKKAQDISAELKVKEAELQKFLADAQKKLKDTTSPLERKNLEEKLTEEFKNKGQKFREYQMQQMKAIEDNIFSTIEVVANGKKIDVVLNKASVLIGGADLTEEVLTKLNAK